MVHVFFVHHPKGPSTQCFRTPVPKSMSSMAVGSRDHKRWVLGPSGSDFLEASAMPAMIFFCVFFHPGGSDRIVSSIEVHVAVRAGDHSTFLEGPNTWTYMSST